MYCDLILGTSSFVDLAAEANTYDDGFQRCCLEDCFDLVHLHVSIVRLSVDSKHSAGCDKEVSAREKMILVSFEDGVTFHP